MTPPSRLAGGVSRSHELRRVELETFARHLGFHLPVVLPDGSVPDVALMHSERRALFVGDAKHTERPTSRATHARLSVYLSWLGSDRWSEPNLFALAYPPGSGPGWTKVLVDLIADAGLVSDRPWTRSLSLRTEVAVVRILIPRSILDPRDGKAV